ncbi:hypothetical protein [Virgibacillus halodenitrificans]|uniref:hypothetical protein n=1 Tax=Virgibacillus halodenitrificans TaxID=1482 RepID=UPI0013CECC09|nr:hypothetical protein [Virgibacillus halodenitrificans]
MRENRIPLFKTSVTDKGVASPTIKKNRKTRSDKCHDVKFPVTKAEQIRLKTQCKQTDYFYKEKHGYDKKLSQTLFNTLLLKYSIHNKNKINWDRSYSDSKTYMHTKLIEREYERIGGPYGYSTRRAMSDRKVVYYLVISALELLEKEGAYRDLL